MREECPERDLAAVPLKNKSHFRKAITFVSFDGPSVHRMERGAFRSHFHGVGGHQPSRRPRRFWRLQCIASRSAAMSLHNLMSEAIPIIPFVAVEPMWLVVDTVVIDGTGWKGSRPGSCRAWRSRRSGQSEGCSGRFLSCAGMVVVKTEQKKIGGKS